MKKLFQKALVLLDHDVQETERSEVLPSHECLSSDRKDLKRSISWLATKQTVRGRCLVECAEHLASKIQDADGYDWCIDALRRSGFSAAAHQVLLSKADSLVVQRKFQEAILIYKAKSLLLVSSSHDIQELMKTSEDLNCCVSKRLACLYTLKEETEEAMHHTQISTALDRYSPECWINKGNVHLIKEELSHARKSYEEALLIDPESTEAIYNNG